MTWSREICLDWFSTKRNLVRSKLKKKRKVKNFTSLLLFLSRVTLDSLLKIKMLKKE